MTKEIIFKTQIKREPGYLYYCGTDEYGNIVIGRALMKQREKKQE